MYAGYICFNIIKSQKLIISSTKEKYFFLIIYWIFRWYLNWYYSMILIGCQYLISHVVGLLCLLACLYACMYANQYESDFIVKLLSLSYWYDLKVNITCLLVWYSLSIKTFSSCPLTLLGFLEEVISVKTFDLFIIFPKQLEFFYRIKLKFKRDNLYFHLKVKKIDVKMAFNN